MAIELYFGIVAPVGVPYPDAVDHLTHRLNRLGADVETIKLSKLICEVPTITLAPHTFEDERVAAYMSAGNDVRKLFNDEAALVQVAAVTISELRKKRELRVER